jgi:hypothetical protein
MAGDQIKDIATLIHSARVKQETAWRSNLYLHRGAMITSALSGIGATVTSLEKGLPAELVAVLAVIPTILITVDQTLNLAKTVGIHAANYKRLVQLEIRLRNKKTTEDAATDEYLAFLSSLDPGVGEPPPPPPVQATDHGGPPPPKNEPAQMVVN